MITVSFYKNEDDIYNGFKMIGHAGYADFGFDIICASVSVLVINTINSIETFASEKFTCNSDEEEGYIEFLIEDSISDKTKLLIDSLLLGLKSIQDMYGQQYITINY